MFDLWLTKSSQIVQEIIEESNLKEIVQQKINEYRNSQEFKEWLENQVTIKLKASAQAAIEDLTDIEYFVDLPEKPFDSKYTGDDLFVSNDQLFYLPTDQNRFAVFADENDVVMNDGIAIEAKSNPLYVYNQQIDALEYCVMNTTTDTLEPEEE